MFRKLLTVALLAVTVSAFAINAPARSSTTINAYRQAPRIWFQGDITVTGKTNRELRARVELQANDCLSGGDRFRLAYLLDRDSREINNVVLRSLCGAQRQAVMITDHMLDTRFPADAPRMTLATSSDLHSASFDWSGEERGSRPMRLLMTRPKLTENLSHAEAREILMSTLSAADASILEDWWLNRAEDSDKDVLSRLVKDDATLSYYPFYYSVYRHG